MKLYHMSGAGNDFMVIDARGLKPDFSALAVRLCKTYRTDGFMALDVSETADFRLHFYNADGSRGEMCGNGARCICKLAYDLGIAGPEMQVQTDAGLVSGWRISENCYRVKLNTPGVVDLHRKQDIAYVELGDPGIPHCVLHIPGLTHEMQATLRPLAVQLRYDPAFPKGVNVNFYDRLDENTLRILTYERGVEDYTLACGTGSGAVTTALYVSGQIPQGAITLENPGGALTVTIEGKDGHVENLLLEGPAQLLKIYETLPS